MQLCGFWGPFKQRTWWTSRSMTRIRSRACSAIAAAAATAMSLKMQKPSPRSCVKQARGSVGLGCARERLRQATKVTSISPHYSCHGELPTSVPAGPK